MKAKTFLRGIHIDDMKHITRDKRIEDMPAPADLFFGLTQHMGKAAVPVVEAGSLVKKGQLIAKADGALSSNIFSSVSGSVTGIVKRRNNLNILCDYIHIKNDFQNDTVFLAGIKHDKEAILKRVFEAGIVGMGGAGFPTAIKLAPKNPVDTLIINGAECEPYLNCDNRVMIECADGVIAGIKYLAIALGVKNIFVGIEINKPEAIKALDAVINKNNIEEIKIAPLKKKYPQGAEKQLIYAVSHRKVPTGGLPSDVGCVVQNIQTAYALYEAVENNKPLYERVMTVSGQGINEPKNIRFATGTPHADVIAFCGGMKENTVKLIAGGPMMGAALTSTGGVLGKTDGGLLALVDGEANTANPTPCIKCGRCSRNCPMNLMPLFIDFYSLVGDYAETVKYGAKDCIECGVCSYVCPAKRTLVQSIKLAKAKLKELKL